MTKKLLVYNMPADSLEKLGELKDKYEFEIIQAEKSHLGQQVGDILEEKSVENIIDQDFDHIDINFLMIHNFSNQELDEFLKDLKTQGLQLPNKCISTETNKTWVLYELLKENKEESELMPILHGLFKVRQYADHLINKNGESADLLEVSKEITDYIAKKDFEKESMKDLYNRSARIVNNYMEIK